MTRLTDCPTRKINPRRGVSAVRRARWPGSLIIQAAPDFLTKVPKPTRAKNWHQTRAWTWRMFMYAIWMAAFGGQPIEKRRLVKAFVEHALRKRPVLAG
jgi:hypothetical protein